MADMFLGILHIYGMSQSFPIIAAFPMLFGVVAKYVTIVLLRLDPILLTFHLFPIQSIVIGGIC